jgi:hypothetical protein
MGSIYAWMIWEQDCHKQHNWFLHSYC